MTLPLQNSNIEEIVDSLSTARAARPTIIAIAGGSASGKTTIALELEQALGSSCTLIHQDSFQLGKKFRGKKTSQYKWDDPENFQLGEAAKTLKDIISGKTAMIPNFDVKTNESIGYLTVEPRQYIIWEGIYAFLTRELYDLSDTLIFVDAPFWFRFIRRVGRFLESDPSIIEDYSVPARQALTFVLEAHTDFVITQRPVSNIQFQFDTDGQGRAISDYLFQRAKVHEKNFTYIPKGSPMREQVFYDIHIHLYNDAVVITDQQGNQQYVGKVSTDDAQRIMRNWDKTSGLF